MCACFYYLVSSPFGVFPNGELNYVGVFLPTCVKYCYNGQAACAYHKVTYLTVAVIVMGAV
jgi:hypothetical protein